MTPPSGQNCPQEYTVDSRQGRRSETVCRMNQTAGQQQALDQIAAELAATAGPALPGTLVGRAYECGQPACRPRPRRAPWWCAPTNAASPAAAATPAPPPGTAPTPNGPAKSAARPSP